MSASTALLRQSSWQKSWRCSGMLNDARGFEHIYLCCGYTDLRKGIDGLISVVTGSFGLDPALPGSIFLFCGWRTQSALLEQNKKLTEKIEDLTEQIAILNQNRFGKHSETAKQIEGQLSFNDFGTEQKPAHSTTASQRRQKPMASSHMDTWDIWSLNWSNIQEAVCRMRNWKHLRPGRTRYRRYATKNKIRAQKLTGLYGRFFICCIREIILEFFIVVYILKNSKMTGYLPFTSDGRYSLMQSHWLYALHEGIREQVWPSLQVCASFSP